MWIPHFVLEFWESEAPSKAIKASQDDLSERLFQVWFCLEDPQSRQIQDSGLSLSKPQNRNMNDSNGREASVKFIPNEKGRLGSIGFRLADTSAKSAFRYCYNHLSQLLSIWSLIVSTGFSIYGFTVFDEKHNITWKSIPQTSAPEDFNVPSDIGLTPEHAAMLSLYREGRNTSSPFYRFLCFYKILEAWYKNKSVFGKADRIIKEKAYSFCRPKRKVTKEMLTLSLLFKSKPEFEQKTYGRVFELLNPFRVQVAHAITNTGKFVNLDKYEFMLEIAAIANLTDLIVRQILLDEFDLWLQIKEAERK